MHTCMCAAFSLKSIFGMKHSMIGHELHVTRIMASWTAPEHVLTWHHAEAVTLEVFRSQLSVANALGATASGLQFVGCL